MLMLQKDAELLHPVTARQGKRQHSEENTNVDDGGGSLRIVKRKVGYE